MSTPAFDPGQLIADFFDTSEDDTGFANLTSSGQLKASILKSNFDRAQTSLTARRNRFLSDFGFDASGAVNPQAQFGTFQNTLREGGAFLDSFLGNDAARGFGEGSGLSRSGLGFAREQVQDQKDQLGQQFTDTIFDFGQSEADLRSGFATDLVSLRDEDRDLKVDNEQFDDPVIDTGLGGQAAQDAIDAAAPEKNISKAASFARNRLIAARRAGIKIGAIPKKPEELAAKWRRVSARLTPVEKAKLAKQLKGA